MSYKFKLNHVNGASFEWVIQDDDIVKDRHGHVLAFTVRFKDGQDITYALGNDGGFVNRLLSTPLSSVLTEASGAGAGATLGRRYGTVGSVLGLAAGWVAAEIAENVVIHSASYYDDNHNESFRGVITI